MTPREAILTTLHGNNADRIPFYHYWRRLQTGELERLARNQGMGVGWVRPCYTTSMPHVEVIQREIPGSGETITEYHTPIGSVTERVKKDAGIGQWKAQRSWRDVTPWMVERRIKDPQDYAVVKYMVEDMIFTPDPFPIQQAKNWLGQDGIVIAGLPHSPMQMLMIDWIGAPHFFIHYARYKSKVEELYTVLAQRYEELYSLAAKSQADFVNFGDNLDGVLVNPRLFEQYFMPCYNKCAQILKASNKLMASHFDGRLDVLKHLIAKCPQDIIEAFHPPPMGDLPLHEALSLWKDKIILAGFPGSEYALGPDHVKAYLHELLKTILPAERVIFIASTENLVSDNDLLTLSTILGKTTLPLSSQNVATLFNS
jgi:hypothetical protein